LTAAGRSAWPSAGDGTADDEDTDNDDDAVNEIRGGDALCRPKLSRSVGDVGPRNNPE